MRRFATWRWCCHRGQGASPPASAPFRSRSDPKSTDDLAACRPLHSRANGRNCRSGEHGDRLVRVLIERVPPALALLSNVVSAADRIALAVRQLTLYRVRILTSLIQQGRCHPSKPARDALSKPRYPARCWPTPQFRRSELPRSHHPSSTPPPATCRRRSRRRVTASCHARWSSPGSPAG